MKVCIHRGTQQIGGSCVEVEHQGSRIVLDLGLPLDAEQAVLSLLPPVAGFVTQDSNLLGVFISHPHLDHYGLVRFLPESVPIFIGEAAEQIVAAAAPFLPDAPILKAAGHLKDRQPLVVGPFTVTPYLVDHSAYDAYALLVEAGGQRLFYSGDLRGHGRKAALFDRLVQKPPSNVDVLLMEGSSIGRLDSEDRFPTETELEAILVDEMKAASGLVLAYASAQNIDRVVTVFRAAKRSGRTLIIDLYAAAVLAATGNKNIPQSDWKDVRLFVPNWQRRRIAKDKLFDLLHAHDANRIFPEGLAEAASKSVLLFRPSMSGDLERAECLEGARLIWSQWDGYLVDPRFKAFLDWRDRHSVPMTRVHTSGHASIADLKLLAGAIDARRLVPIHSFETARYGEFFSRVEPHEDGQWWEV